LLHAVNGWEDDVHRSSRAALFMMAFVVAIGSIFAFPAAAQQKCTDADVVGTASGKDRAEAFEEADKVWLKEATAKLGTSEVFHGQLRLKCEAAKGKGDITCTVSAKACGPGVPSGPARRPSCHMSGKCEICCDGPGRPVCRPICR
jgi:hypothetical protein